MQTICHRGQTTRQIVMHRNFSQNAEEVSVNNSIYTDFLESNLKRFIYLRSDSQYIMCI